MRQVTQYLDGSAPLPKLPATYVTFSMLEGVEKHQQALFDSWSVWRLTSTATMSFATVSDIALSGTDSNVGAAANEVRAERAGDVERDGAIGYWRRRAAARRRDGDAIAGEEAFGAKGEITGARPLPVGNKVMDASLTRFADLASGCAGWRPVSFRFAP
ncbi:hypothetical protein C2845_PM05G27530 [Panicum miliaceum]|uniref:Uncharacterized protein n=1 Tax=Panicum miliaceum TaxID=4540 RepID=A0A3L6T083_PANMI|nr:hypothetical protein C2845_PM05G27530 [Panicum miliaceum]